MRDYEVDAGCAVKTGLQESRPSVLIIPGVKRLVNDEGSELIQSVWEGIRGKALCDEGSELTTEGIK